MRCSVAQCLEVVGEWWSMPIVRDAFLAVSRFDQFPGAPWDLAQRAQSAASPPDQAEVLEKARPTAAIPPATTTGSPKRPGPVAGAHRHAAVGRPACGAVRPAAGTDAPRLRPYLARRDDLLGVREADRAQRRPGVAWARGGRAPGRPAARRRGPRPGPSERPRAAERRATALRRRITRP